MEGDDEVMRREMIETQIKRYRRGEHTTWERTDDGGLVVTHHLPAIRMHPYTHLPTLFTGLATYYNAQCVPGAKQMFGNVTPFKMEWLEKLAGITEEIWVSPRWEEGDALVFDNVGAQHGRQSWGGEQGSKGIGWCNLWDGVVARPYRGQEWARVGRTLDV